MSTSLRVLVVTVVHDPEDARIRHRQIPAILAAGHQVVYAAPFSAFGREAPDGVRGLDLPRAQGRRRLRAVLAARRLIARVGPAADVVLVHDPDLILSVAGLGRRIPTVVWDVHEDTAAALSMRGWVPGPLRPALAGAVRLAERYAESRHKLLLAEHGYQRRFRKQHPVVPNTVRVPHTAPPAPGEKRVVYLGKITRARGAAELIELAKQVPDVEIEIIGPAESEIAEEIEQAAEAGLLTWTGFVPNQLALQKLPGALAGISLLHDEPNYNHSPPTKLMEYMAHGIPVISTPNAASRHLVERSGGGAMVPFGNIDAVAAVVRRWRENVEERRSLGAAGYQYARAHLDWAVDGAQFADALVSIATRRDVREAESLPP